MPFSRKSSPIPEITIAVLFLSKELPSTLGKVVYCPRPDSVKFAVIQSDRVVFSYNTLPKSVLSANEKVSVTFAGLVVKMDAIRDSFLKDVVFSEVYCRNLGASENPVKSAGRSDEPVTDHTVYHNCRKCFVTVRGLSVLISPITVSYASQYTKCDCDS